MKKAGTRHSSTCSRAYHLARWSASITALSNLDQPSGSQKQARKPATIQASDFHSAFHSMRLRLRQYAWVSPPGSSRRSE